MPFHRFYVPVGLRGILLKAGMILPGVLGPMAYWWAWSRREDVPPTSLETRRDTPEAEKN